MYCTKCGAEFSEGARRCSQCGASLTGYSTAVSHTAGGPPPQNYLVHSILVTVLCCLPFGIPAIVYAAQVDGKYASGDYTGAAEASRNAYKWVQVAFFVGLGWMILNFGFVFLPFIMAAAAGH